MALGPLLRCSSCGVVVAVTLAIGVSAPADEFVVVSTADSGTGSLREAISLANQNAGEDRIVFDAGLAGQTITLESDLTRIEGALEIDGAAAAGVAVAGGGQHRVFFVESGDVSIRNLDVSSAAAEGGDGSGGGGGGLGAGGGLFVDQGASVTIENVSFDGNLARGGAGGDGMTAGGGGGGLAGDGGIGAGGGGGFAGRGGDGDVTAGAGGGGGLDEDGSAGAAGVGGSGGGPNGGEGGQAGLAGADGGERSGGGGAGSGEADGGDGGSFGGGGGATGTGVAGNGGTFGGGGGAPDGTGGNGGFGGGGGGGVMTGSAGFGGGDGASTGPAQGGRGAGGAVFVRQGGTLRIVDGDFGVATPNAVANGAGRSSGDAAGEDLFAMTGVDVTFEVGEGRTSTSAGSIGGDGSLTKAGSGTLVLQGDNDYAGGTSVSQGTLEGDADSLQGAISIAQDATLVFAQTGTGRFEGTLSGAGSLEKTGTGTLVLEGDSGHSGDTTVSQGTLEGNTDNLVGDVAIAASATLVFDQSQDGTYAATLSGAGVLVKNGSATLVLTGDNGHTGDTTVADGTLRADTDSLTSAKVAIGSGASLVLDQNAEGSFAAELEGAGGFEKRGSGRLTLTGSAETFTGSAVVATGALVLGDVTLGGQLTVSEGAELNGSGSVAGALEISGTLSPGPAESSDIANVVAGSAQFGPDAVFEVQIDEALDSDRIDSSGMVEIDGTLEVSLRPGAYEGETFSYDVITAGGGFDGGSFELVSPELAFFEPLEIEQGPNELSVLLRRNGETFGTIGSNANQRAVGTALDAATATEELQQILDDLTVESTSVVNRALDEISGDTLANFTTTRLANSERFRDLAMRRLGQLENPDAEQSHTARVGGAAFSLGWNGLLGEAGPWGGSIAALAAAGPRPVAAAAGAALDDIGLGVWIDAYGAFGDVDSDSRARGFDYTIVGGAGGLDYRLTDELFLGAAGGYAYTDLDSDRDDSSGDVDSILASVYAGYVGEWAYLGSVLHYARDDMESRRRISTSQGAERPKADFDGDTYSAYIEGGVLAFRVGGWRIEPMAAFDYTRVEHDSFREKGSGALDLAVDDESLDSYVSSAGVRVRGSFEFEQGAFLLPELWARWDHEFGDTDRRIDARLSGDLSGNTFVARGSEPGRDSARFGAGWRVRTPHALDVFVYYDGHWNTRFTAHGVSGGLALRW